MTKIGFIDYYLDEWHANNYPAWIKDRSNGGFEVAYCYGDIASPHSKMTSEAWAEKYGIELCATQEELIEKSDCLIVLSPDNPEQHERLCELACKSGKPLYIDKTFAPDGDTARRIFAVADEAGTPCYSTSALRFAECYKNLDNVTHIQSFGGGKLEIYVIHQLEPIVKLMGAGCKRVMYVGDGTNHTVVLDFDGRVAELHMMPGEDFSMKVFTDKTHSLVATGNFWNGFIDALLEFFRTREVPVPHEETISIAAIRAAALEAEKTPFEWVDVK